MSRAYCRTSITVCVPGSGAYSCMPLLPEVTGTVVPSPSSRSRSATRWATAAHSASPAGAPGSRSTTSRSGLWIFPRGPTRHCGVCSSSAPWFAAHTSPARSSRNGSSSSAPSSSAPGAARSVCRRTQSGAPRGVFFSKNFSPPTPSGQRIRVTGRSLQLGEDRRRHLDQVVHHLGLGHPRRRVHDLLQVADPDLAALDVDHLPFGCHGCSHGSASVSVRTARTTGWRSRPVGFRAR